MDFALTPKERADSYAFQLGGAMVQVVNMLCGACPDAVVDFDITEGGRTVGLQFLAAGKYFLINNGPYSMNYDMPIAVDGDVNLFFFPGPARGWICRTPLAYDKWIPSVLFLTHYLPDDVYLQQDWQGPRQTQNDANQWISLASLVLGQNGIWGDLLSVTEAGIARFAEALSVCKSLRGDITSAALIRTGAITGSPEIYEKISKTGTGVVSVFASVVGTCYYVTQAKVAPGVWHNGKTTIRADPTNHAMIKAHFDEPGAKLLFFGTDQ